MTLKDKLDIVLITYNRKTCLGKTFEQIFGKDSPIKDFDITILDNASTDGTSELVEKYCKNFPNIKHIINHVNIGGCPNIAKALVETPNKPYVWVLCDNDDFDFSVWNEIESAINNDYDVIYTRNCPKTPAGMFYTATLVPACIYKTSIIDSTVAENIYDSIPSLFPHLAIISSILNNSGSVYIASKDIVISGINPEHNSTFVRGVDKENLPEARRKILWSVGYFSTLELISDKKMRAQIIDGTRHYHKSLFDLFKTFMVKNRILHKNYFYNFLRIFRMLNLVQKIKFVAAFLLVNLSFKDYTFYEIREKSGWIEYFNRINEQKYLNKLAKKLKGKKVLLYGAGMVSEILLKNYNFEEFDIAGISDKRFERTDEKEFCSIKAIKPEDIKKEDFDTILFCMKLFKNPLKALKSSGIKSKMHPAIKPDYHYVIRS